MNAKTNKLLVGVLVLQSMILAGQWTGSSLLAPAEAQIPDAGADRRAMVEELKAMNAELRSVGAKVERLTSTVEGGKVRVTVIKDERK